GQPRRCEHRRFNEFYMLHASTSPFYPLWASLDVGAQMMKGRNGTHLWDQAIRTSIEMRKIFRQLRARYISKDYPDEQRWFFDPFVPHSIDIKGSPHHPDVVGAQWEDISTDVLALERQ